MGGVTLNKCFIIDDDVQAVQSIFLSFDWNKLNIDEVVKICDCNNLIERIINEKPEIVFIDIEMGNVSGLDIISDCKKHNSSANFVVVSGHDNFKYAQKAVNLNSVHYILKPLETQDIETVTEKLLKLQNQDDGQSLDGNPFYDKENFEAFFSKKINFSSDYCYCCLICYIPEVYRFDLNDLIRSFVSLYYKLGENKFFYILNIKANIEQLKTVLNNYAIIKPVVFGLSNLFNSLSDFYKQFTKANILSLGCFINQKQRLFYSEKSNTDIIKTSIDNFMRIISLKLSHEVDLFFNDLPTKFSDAGLNIAHVLTFYNYCILYINSLSSKKAEDTLLLTLSIDELFENFSTLNNMCNDLCLLVKEMLNNSLDFASMENVELEKNIDAYIHKNYNKKITVPVLCQSLLINTTYFYSYFKKHKNCTFTAYLTDYRIKIAKQLLQSTNQSVSAIAEAVGFSDCFYFTKVFKSLCGVTPSNYKTNCER